jgi:hypothetical protein
VVTKPRWRAFALSVCIHVGGLAFLVWVDSASLLQVPSSRSYQVHMLPKEKSRDDKILWYDFRTSLPEIAPERRIGRGSVPRGKMDPSGETVIARSPKAKSSSQFIWQPDRPEPIPIDVPTPNLIALTPGATQPVPKPPLKAFSPPPSAPLPKPAAVVLPDQAPAVEAPKLPVATGGVLQELADLSPVVGPKRPLKQFVAPSAPRTSAPAGEHRLAEPPSERAPGGSPGGAGEGLQGVIVGLNPAPGPSPQGSRPGKFAIAPAAGAASSGNSAQPGAPTVPGLMIHGAAGQPADASAAPANPAAPERRIRKDLVLPAMHRTMSVPLRPSSRVIPALVEARFAGRDVYTLLVPGPPLPEYTGDWILWFSERQAAPGVSQRILAPIPIRKYASDEAAAASADAPAAGTVQLSAIIDREGRVSAAKALTGATLSDAFRLRAVEELKTWEFQPALRNGEPVDVDIVVEISFQFRLAQPAR